MAEAPRISCCIVGCRRTSKRRPGWRFWICSRHYGCAADLKESHKFWKKVVRRRIAWKARLVRRWGTGTLTYAAEDQAIERASTWEHAAFMAIEIRAQAMQDWGVWAPKPRMFRKRASNAAAKMNMPKVAHSFEQEFQRVKRQMDEGRRIRT